MTTAPVRIRRSRLKGSKLPPNTVIVTRPTKWGNYFVVGEHGDAAQCVAKFRAELESEIFGEMNLMRVLMRAALAELRGKNLACWCKLDAPCHADVLLDLANRPQIETQ